MSPIFKKDFIVSADKLWLGGEFVVQQNSTVEVTKKGQLEEYPAVNVYPPFWRDLKDVQSGGTEIGMFKLCFYYLLR